MASLKNLGMKDFEDRIEVIYEFPFPKKWKWKFFKSLLRKVSRTKTILFCVRKNLQKKSGSLIKPQNFWLKFWNVIKQKSKKIIRVGVSNVNFDSYYECAPPVRESSRARGGYLKHMCISFRSITSDQCSSLDHLGVWHNTIYDLNPSILFSMDKIVRIW